MPDLTLGPPMIYIPVCKHPRDYQHTAGPVGWERVEVLGECPLLLEPPTVQQSQELSHEEIPSEE